MTQKTVTQKTGGWFGDLSLLDGRTIVRAIAYAAIAAVAIAIPTELIDTPLFHRPIPPRTIDYVIAGITSALIGLIFAIRPGSNAAASQESKTWIAGAGSLLAVGCPVCNVAVVALVGTSGALSWWAPIQPVIGVVSIALLIYTLRLRLRTANLEACPIPGR